RFPGYRTGNPRSRISHWGSPELLTSTRPRLRLIRITETSFHDMEIQKMSSPPSHSLPYLANCSLLFTEQPLLQRPAATNRSASRSAGGRRFPDQIGRA